MKRSLWPAAITAIVLATGAVLWLTFPGSDQSATNPPANGSEATAQAEYFEAEAGELIPATVSWRVVSAEGKSAVVADIAVPGRNLTATIAFVEETLTYGPVVEITFDNQSASPDQTVISVDALAVLPPGSADSGEYLLPVISPVMAFEPGALPGHRLGLLRRFSDGNIAVLDGADAFALFFFFSEGRRGGLMFEKGPQGHAAFEEALAQWNLESFAETEHPNPFAGEAAIAAEAERAVLLEAPPEIGGMPGFDRPLTQEDVANGIQGGAVWERGVTPDGQPQIVVTANIAGGPRTVEMRISGHDIAGFQMNPRISIFLPRAQSMPGGGVLSVPLVLIDGEPVVGGVSTMELVGAGFLIGVAAAPAEQAFAQLIDAQWLEIPIVYYDGSRAHLAIEVGADGHEIITEIVNAWRN